MTKEISLNFRPILYAELEKNEGSLFFILLIVKKWKDSKFLYTKSCICRKYLWENKKPSTIFVCKELFFVFGLGV